MRGTYESWKLRESEPIALSTVYDATNNQLPVSPVPSDGATLNVGISSLNLVCEDTIGLGNRLM